MTDEEQKSVNELMQYAMMSAAPTVTPGWGTYPIAQQLNPPTTAGEQAVTLMDPEQPQ